MTIFFAYFIIGPITIISIVIWIIVACINKAIQNSNETNAAKAVAFPYLLFRCLGKLAAADGDVNEAEINYFKKLCFDVELFGQLEQKLISACSSGARSQKSFYQLLYDLKPHVNSAELTEAVLGMFLKLALIDGDLNQNEATMLIAAGRVFQDEQFVNLIERFDEVNTSDGNDEDSSGNDRELVLAYQTLGVPATATNDEVKSAYRPKIRKFHPDNIQSKELPEEFLEFAKSQAQEINEAYHKICEARGMK